MRRVIKSDTIDLKYRMIIISVRGNSSVMIGFFEVCNDTREKLDRNLSKVEKDFLKWMYKRYEQEQRNFNDQDKIKDDRHL